MQRGAGRRVNSVGCDDLVDVAVRVEADRIVRDRQRVAVPRAGGDAEVAQHHTATRGTVNSYGNRSGGAAGPKGNALIEFDVKAVGFIEGDAVVVDDVEVDEIQGGS